MLGRADSQMCTIQLYCVCMTLAPHPPQICAQLCVCTTLTPNLAAMPIPVALWFDDEMIELTEAEYQARAVEHNVREHDGLRLLCVIVR